MWPPDPSDHVQSKEKKSSNFYFLRYKALGSDTSLRKKRIEQDDIYGTYKNVDSHDNSDSLRYVHFHADSGHKKGVLCMTFEYGFNEK